MLNVKLWLDFMLPVTTAKTAEMQAVQGVASTVQGAYIDFRTLDGARLPHATRSHGEGL